MKRFFLEKRQLPSYLFGILGLASISLGVIFSLPRGLRLDSNRWAPLYPDARSSIVTLQPLLSVAEHSLSAARRRYARRVLWPQS